MSEILSQLLILKQPKLAQFNPHYSYILSYFNVPTPWRTAVVHSRTPRFPREKTARAPELHTATSAKTGEPQAGTQ